MTEVPARIKIPRDRIGVLIGPNGYVKRKIENMCGVNLKIDSASGDVEVTLKPETVDPTSLFKAENIVNAIGRGFSPEKAFKLNDDDVLLEVIDLYDYVGKSESNLQRIKGRLIGEKGKTRKITEETTGANISIFGHTVAIIGELDKLAAAKRAIQMLISGSQHSTVYRWLHRKRRELKKAELELWETRGERVAG